MNSKCPTNILYYFGIQILGRSFASKGYRWGFNGQERDDEIYGSGNSYTAEYWQYDSRLGRRWNVDPVDKPWMSSYHAFSNKPVLNADPNGACDDCPKEAEELNMATEEGTVKQGQVWKDKSGKTFEFDQEIGWLPTNSDQTFSENIELLKGQQYSIAQESKGNDKISEGKSTIVSGIGAFSVANGVKTELIEFAGKSSSLGKAGVKYLRYAKGLGYVGSGVTTTYAIIQGGRYYYNGGTDWQVGVKATLDVIMTGVGFLGPIGLSISATYFIVDASGGFGDFGKIEPQK